MQHKSDMQRLTKAAGAHHQLYLYDMASVKVYTASPPTGSLCHRRNEILFHTAHAQTNTRGPTSCNCVYVCVLGCCNSAGTYLLHECFGCSHHHIGVLAVPQLPCKICMSSLPHRMLRSSSATNGAFHPSTHEPWCCFRNNEFHSADPDHAYQVITRDISRIKG